MGTLLGQSIVDDAWTKLQDPTGVRWTSAEALKGLNAGQREIVNQLPTAYVLEAKPTAQAGSRQTLAGLGLSGVQIMDVLCNYDASGTTQGRAITRRDRVHFDDARPYWRQESAAEAIHYMPDERDPKAFDVWPAVLSGRLEILYAAMPADLASLASPITLDDIYGNALQWWLLFWFYAKDTKAAGASPKASSYLQLFFTTLGVRGKALLETEASGDAKAGGG